MVGEQPMKAGRVQSRIHQAAGSRTNVGNGPEALLEERSCLYGAVRSVGVGKCGQS